MDLDMSISMDLDATLLADHSWSSIINFQKLEEPSVPPYVHPMVRRCASSLMSEKSLEICTEILGSETGSDRFSSSYPDEENKKKSDVVLQDLAKLQLPQEDEEDQQQLHLEKYYYKCRPGLGKKRQQQPIRSFPPPLPWLSRPPDGGPSLFMQSRRDNGRLVLEAISVHSEKKNFCVQRQDGRLVLTFNVNKYAGDDINEAVGEKGQEEQEEVLDHDELFLSYGESYEKVEEEGEDEEVVEVEDEDDDETEKLIFATEDVKRIQ